MMKGMSSKRAGMKEYMATKFIDRKRNLRGHIFEDGISKVWLLISISSAVDENGNQNYLLIKMRNYKAILEESETNMVNFQ